MKKNLNIKSKKIIFTNDNQIEGWLKLKNGTKTFFNINKYGEWEQWGNSRDNLFLTVSFITELAKISFTEDY